MGVDLLTGIDISTVRIDVARPRPSHASGSDRSLVPNHSMVGRARP